MQLQNPLLYIFPILVVGLVLYIVFQRNKYLEEENGKTPLHAEVCGGFFGFFNYPIFLVRFAIYEEFIVISYAGKILLRYNEIDKIEIKKRPRSYGIFITHHKKDIPSNIWVWSRKGEEVKDVLKTKIKFKNLEIF